MAALLSSSSLYTRPSLSSEDVLDVGWENPIGSGTYGKIDCYNLSKRQYSIIENGRVLNEINFLFSNKVYVVMCSANMNTKESNDEHK